MANILTTNPIQIDTAGSTSEILDMGIRKITGIGIIASGDTSVALIHSEAAGTNVLFHYIDEEVAGPRSYYWSLARPLAVTGIYVTTMTDVDMILIYT